MKIEIMEKLHRLEKELDIKIQYAVESGSRAWGFASKNSDYDVRFIYKRNISAYLSLFPPRDVIELPIEDEWDINGWDIYKVLRLLLKSNPAIMEWLFSPIVYMEENTLVPKLRHWVTKHYSLKRIGYHYFYIARDHYHRFLQNKSDVQLKKYLYTLRPLICLRWLEQNQTPPPTQVKQVLVGIEWDQVYRENYHELVRLKKEAQERSVISSFPQVEAMIISELERAEEVIKQLPDHREGKEELEEILFAELALVSS
ncbi:nucleotidyltransferase domain-containing protein [Thermoflavimicrobium daqui]|uniref:Nucleotidyltransferase n=1 Tax=Thermoflavimicrobium daqui TaxID=2137476 RepID=A0A364K694_9BACL|nr:nucleotidyltransferase domain-containing protein [Thermoflavimicrobium daqui]RAL25732.1 nucleotidyltransferase [Thermoflavimicrobium daqui]